MKKIPSIRYIALLLFFVASFGVANEPGVNSKAFSRQTLSLDQGWRFHLGDIPLESFAGGEGIRLYGPNITDNGSKAGLAWGAAARGFDDSSWQQIHLPHDWVVEQPFDAKAEKAQGYRPRNIAWYRRDFNLEEADKGRNIELQFDGVATDCTVYFNGTQVHHNWSAYKSFAIDVTSLARYGGNPNTIAVRVDARPMEGWWYEGGGIYRHAWLVKRSPLHIATDGVYANPVKIKDGKWRIPTEVTLVNKGFSDTTAFVEMTVYDDQGKKIAEKRSRASIIGSMDESLVKLSVPVRAPQLWSLESPNLYTVKTTLIEKGMSQDVVLTKVGFRTIEFDANKGFFLNGQHVKIQGTANHQDHAGVGVAVPDSLWDFRIRKLKEMGSNAYRSAHNPPSKEFLDAADRLGMLVMDETRQFNTSPEYLDHLEWLIRRDRNHPSVIIWSLFNEEPLEVNSEGKEIARVMNAVVKRLDKTRPTTGAQNKGQLGPDGKLNPQNAAQVLDVVGINYQAGDYDKIRAAYPDKPIISTEDTSQVMSRGEYASDYQKNIIASYDDVFPGWDRHSSARNSWQAIAQQESFAGGFSWTGFAYRGEPTPFGWPSASSFFGAMDLCGFPKAEFYIRQALWTHDKPVLNLIPHWNWAGREGQPIKVLAATNAEKVKLFLNGKLIEESNVDPFQMVSWNVPYTPGKLEAVAYTRDKEVARTQVETTGDPVALRLVADRYVLQGDGADATPVRIEAIDRLGRVVPTAKLSLELKVQGPGSIIGVGNGDPNSHAPEKGNKLDIYNGLAQVIVQGASGALGGLLIEAYANGLASGSIELRVKTND